MEIRVHFTPFAGELSILCEEDPGLFPILFTRVKFTAASLPVWIPFSPPSPALFVCTCRCSENELLGCRWLSIQGAFVVILLWHWMDKRRRVTVRRQVFQQTHIYSLNTPNPSPLPLQSPLLSLPTPITVFLTKPSVHNHAAHYIPIVPCCPL